MPKDQDNNSRTAIVLGNGPTAEQAVTSALLDDIAAEVTSPSPPALERSDVPSPSDFDGSGKEFANVVMLPMVLWSAGMSWAFSFWTFPFARTETS
ncbi:hypothetical protein [Rhizobium grahamii]|uniref:hypothetical protein n=1 Tax=Rhizobium grahamii TaxID=1120045 RepID=UPI0011AFF1BF|nr:hypothetical protein [Rhizobium grahamii]